MMDNSGDKASKVLKNGSLPKEETPKIIRNVEPNVSSYDPRKLYIRNNMNAKKEEESCSSSSSCSSIETCTGSDNKESSNLKRKAEDSNQWEHEKRRTAKYLMLPTPKKYLIGRGPSSSVLYNTNPEDSSPSSYDSCSDSDTELSTSSSSDE